MRIALVAPPWLPVPPPAYGGTEAVLDGLARGLVRAGHEVLLCTTGDSTCPVPRAWYFERSLGVSRPDGQLLELRHVVASYAAAVEAGVELVHDHTLSGPLYAVGFTSLPTVTTNHNPFGEGSVDYYAPLSTKVPVIAISRAQAAEADGVRLAGVIPHGIDLAEYPVGDGRGGYALFLGRMAPAKGVDVAARVARRAGVRLVIAARCGAAEELDYFHDQVEPLLGGGVDFVEEVGGADKLALLGGATCLLNPIAWPEPFGLVMLEALACGTPVVATRRGAAPEIVEDGVSGYLRDDEEGLLAALEGVGRLERAACRERAARFSLEAMVEGHLAVYREVLSGLRAG